MNFLIKGALEEIAKGVAVGTAADILDKTIDAVDAVSDRLQISKTTRLEKFQETMLSIHPSNSHLWMTESVEEVKTSLLSSSFVTVYSFFTTNGDVLYTAKRIPKGRAKGFFLYDASGAEIGSIASHRIKGSNPFEVKTNGDIFELEMFFRNEPVGIVTNAIWKAKYILYWDIPNWGIMQEKKGKYQIVSSDGKEIASISSKSFDSKKVTFIDYSNMEQEKAVVLFILSMIAYENQIC